MNRLSGTIAAAGAGLVLAACGSASASSSSSAASPSGGAFGRGASGQLVQISGNTLILSNANGDTTVTYASGTIVIKTRTGTVANIVPGVCVTAAGQKNGSGEISAATVAVSSPVNGSCGSGGLGGGGGFGGRSPNPSFSPRAGFGNRSVVRGLVVPGGVSGTSVTVQQQKGGTVTFTIPTTVRVTMSSTVSASALQTGECVSAVGQRNASGVVAARLLTIVPAGPNGCFSGGGGGFGGFGGGGGALGGGGGSATTTTAATT